MASQFLSCSWRKVDAGILILIEGSIRLYVEKNINIKKAPLQLFYFIFYIHFYLF